MRAVLLSISSIIIVTMLIVLITNGNDYLSKESIVSSNTREYIEDSTSSFSLDEAVDFSYSSSGDSRSSEEVLKGVFDRSSTGEEAYPVTLPAYTLVGLVENYDGTIIGRNEALAQLWNRFGASSEFDNEPAIYRKKIFVVYYSLGEGDNLTSHIFIGYGVFSWLKDKISVNDEEAYVLDIPSGKYMGYDVQGASTRNILAAWDYLYATYPDDIKSRAIEIYNLDSNSYLVESVVLYLKSN